MKRYYVCKWGRILSDYTDYDKAIEHRDLVDGEILTENVNETETK